MAKNQLLRMIAQNLPNDKYNALEDMVNAALESGKLNRRNRRNLERNISRVRKMRRHESA